MTESLWDRERRLHHQLLSSTYPARLVGHATVKGYVDVEAGEKPWGYDRPLRQDYLDLYLFSDGSVRWTQELPLAGDPQLLPEPPRPAWDAE